jgi:hypothetical protein
VHRGPHVVAAGEKLPGGVAAWRGNLDVHGVVNGNAVAIGGDVIVYPGAQIHGDAVSVGGQVRDEGGKVDGEMRSLSALTVGVPTGFHLTPAQATRRALSLAVGWYLVLSAIGLLVLLFARHNLETIADRIQADFARSVLYGVLGEVALFPAFVVGIVVLAVTLIGIVLIPFAVVAYVLAAAGALALGFLAMSFITGDAAMRWQGAAPRQERPPLLQFLLIGLSLYFFLWLVGAAFTWAGVFGGVLKFVVALITWVAVTVGFGATLLSRGGTRTERRSRAGSPPLTDDVSWQTPTPVGGVAAARRPVTPPSNPSRPRDNP